MSQTFLINGRRYRFERKPLGRDSQGYKIHGNCDPPAKANKAFRVSSGIGGRDELESIIHEVRHAENWDMYDELYVEKRSAELAKILWTLGYRKVGDG